MSVVVRPADPSDGAFLTQMLVEAAFWRPEGPRGGVDEVLGQPELAHYVAGWPQVGDLGVVAEAEQPVGAAGLRFFSADDPGYGFVDVGTPELCIGVVPGWRGAGARSRIRPARRTRRCCPRRRGGRAQPERRAGQPGATPVRTGGLPPGRRRGRLPHDAAAPRRLASLPLVAVGLANTWSSADRDHTPQNPPTTPAGTPTGPDRTPRSGCARQARRAPAGTNGRAA